MWSSFTSRARHLLGKLRPDIASAVLPPADKTRASKECPRPHDLGRPSANGPPTSRQSLWLLSSVYPPCEGHDSHEEQPRKARPFSTDCDWTAEQGSKKQHPILNGAEQNKNCK